MEGDPTAGMGWGDVSVNMSNHKEVANDIVDFMNVCGYNMYYLENLGSTNGIMTIRVYNGTR